uniref:ERCC4 domain-containing protein n=1 Tax=Macrostomum lignano TaxID=282301 RepID=A0A1I8FI84_9PLAT
APRSPDSSRWPSQFLSCEYLDEASMRDCPPGSCLHALLEFETACSGPAQRHGTCAASPCTRRPLELLTSADYRDCSQLPQNSFRVYRGQSVGRGGLDRVKDPYTVRPCPQRQQGRIEGSWDSGRAASAITVRMSEPLSVRNFLASAYGGGKRAPKKGAKRRRRRLGSRVRVCLTSKRLLSTDGLLLDYESALQMFLDLFHQDGLAVPRRRPFCPHRLAAQLIRLYSDPATWCWLVNCEAATRPRSYARVRSSAPCVASVAPPVSPAPRAPSPLSSRRPESAAGSTTKAAACFLPRRPRIFTRCVDFLRSVVPTDAGLTRGTLRHSRDPAHGLFVCRRLSCLPRSSMRACARLQMGTPGPPQSALVDLLKACMQELGSLRPRAGRQNEADGGERADSAASTSCCGRYTDPEDPAAFHRRVASVISSEKAFGANSGWLFLAEADRPAGRQQGPPWAPARPPTRCRRSGCRAGPSCRRWSVSGWTSSGRLMALMAPPPSSSGSAPLIIVHRLVYSVPAARLPHLGRRGGLRRDANSAADSADEDAVQNNDNGDDFDMIRPASDVDDQPQQQGDDVEAVEKVDQPTSEIVDESELKRRFPSARLFGPVRLSSRDVRCSAPGWWQRRGPAPPPPPGLLGGAPAGAADGFWTAGRPHRVLPVRPGLHQRSWRCTACAAAGPGRCPLVVYFFVYEGSVEEQRYLTQLRKEKEAFEFLIPQRCRGDERAGCQGRPGASGGTGGTDDGIAAAAAEQHQRAALPAAQARGITILPVTIDVGDYVLTPDICVERKSVVSDLIGSLNSGRLYNQHTRSPVLLIEFDRRAHRLRRFTTAGRHELGTELLGHDLPPEACSPCHFPQLRILWSPRAHAAAAELFHDLKRGRPQPQLGSCCPQFSAATAGDFYNDVDDSEASSSTSLTPAASAATLRQRGAEHAAANARRPPTGVCAASFKSGRGSFAGLCRLGVGELREALGQRGGRPTGCTNFLRTDGRRLAGPPLLGGEAPGAAETAAGRQTADRQEELT